MFLPFAFGASVCSLHVDFVESEVEKLVTLGCLGALELVPLGHIGTLEGC